MNEKESRAARGRGGVGPVVAGAISNPDFIYNGGPVIRSPQVYTMFWGPDWSKPKHTARAQRLNQFMQDLLASEYMNILSQYGVGAGHFVKASLVPSVTGQLDKSGLAKVVQAEIDSGALPEPPATNNNIALVIYLDETIAFSQPGLRMCEPDSDDAFGFHSDFVTRAGNDFYYAVIPCLNDQCVRNTCPHGGGALSLHQTQEERLTQVTSHEFAEMCTDPQYGHGWHGPKSDENGDICNGEADTLTVGPNTWNVQLQYSKTDDEKTGGDDACVLGAPAPMAKRSDGPA